MRVRRLTIQAAVNTFTGYGQLFCEVFAGLERMGVFCSVRSIELSELFGATVPVEIKSRFVQCVQPEDVELLIRNPNMCPTSGKRVYYYTMWESTKLPKEWVRLLNKAERVIVPCEWNKQGFERSGVEVPIYVIPLGINPSIFNYMPQPPDSIFRFGVAGRVAHGPVRKGIRRAIDLFLATFPAISDVELMVKIHPDCDIGAVADKRVKIVREHLDWHGVRKWFSQIHCFVSLATAEGFGLWQLQAMACGRPVLAANYSGTAEHLAPENGFCLPYTLEEVPDLGGGQWANVSDETVKKALLYAYTHRYEVADKGRIASERAMGFTWDRTVQSLHKLLLECGAI